MLTSRDYLEQIVKWHKEGRIDLIKIAAHKRFSAYKDMRKHKTEPLPTETTANEDTTC